ncbi:MAG: thioredoxin-related protein [Saprospiraceae bacterium]|jgi:thioredoxin-related protein
MKYSISIFILFLTTGFSVKAQSIDNNILSSFQKAPEEGKYVLMVFSGSDWCKPCMQLKQKILSNEAFTNYSSNRLLIHEVDFPYKRKNKLSKTQQQQNDELAERYNKEGVFPKVLLFNVEGEIIVEVKYVEYMTPDEFIHLIDSQLEKQ